MATATRSRSGPSPTSSRPDEPAELDDFAAFCGELTLENKEPMALHAFERRMLADYFAGTTETLILISKKNGKTTLMAALALYHLVVTEDAECVIAAASRDQAQIMLRQARGFIRRSPDLQRLMMVKQREITSLVDEGRVRVLASDEDTADGVIPTLAIVDELHRHKSSALYGVFRDGLGPRDGRMLTISTAGDDEDSPLGQMRAAAYALPVFEREASYRYARSADGGYVMHEWALEPDEDRDDMEVVKRANPAPWQTAKRLRERRDSPSMKPWQWARFACGVWLQGENRAIGPVEWGACAGADDAPAVGAVARLGLDVGWKIDTTAIVAHWFDEDGVAHLSPARVLVPPEEQGVALRKDEVLAACEEMRAEYGADTIVLDPENDGEVLAQDLEELGFDVVAHSQKPQPMAQAAERFYAAIRERTVRHPRDPKLTRHVLNAVEKRTDDGRWRFVKENKQSRKVIDALIAAAMVHNIAVEDSQLSEEPLIAWR
jgi:phage terminase large subunit-like protein